MQSQIYGVPNPQHIEQPYPSQNFSNFQYGEVSMPYVSPQIYTAPYEFRRRINKMNWDMIGKVDVGTIAKTNDVQSVEFLMSPIAFANISADDSEHFGSQACLHAFLILQLAVEYLLFRLNTIPPQKYVQQQQPQTPITNQTITNYEARIDLLNKDIKTRDMLINSLSDKMREAEKERDELKAKLTSMTKEYDKISNNNSTYSSASSFSRKSSTKTSKKNDSGLLHMDTDLEHYKEDKLKVKSSRSSKSSYRKDTSDLSYSYYDYSEDEIIPPSVSKHKSKKKENKKPQLKKKEKITHLELDDDWPSSSPWN